MSAIASDPCLRRGDDGLGARAFAAAQAMVGVRFRAQGHDPQTGLDCVGLVRAAYAATGWDVPAPVNYSLRGWSGARVMAFLEAAGLGRVDAPRQVGDVVMILLPARQLHLGIVGATSFVHAHAGLRRVVETPVDAGVLAAARWRLVRR